MIRALDGRLLPDASLGTDFLASVMYELFRQIVAGVTPRVRSWTM